MVFPLLKGVTGAHPPSNQLQYSLKPGSIRKQELKPSRTICSMGPNMASQFTPPFERSRFTQKKNSPRFSAYMFFHPLALSPSLRSVCFSSLSDPPLCLMCVLPSFSPLGSFPLPT